MPARTISSRLSFMKFGPKAQADILNVKAIVVRELPNALDLFYEQVKSFPEAMKFFSSSAVISSAKTKQLAHWDAISSGAFDANYVRAVTTVGEVHARIGLEPRWYIGGYALLLETLVDKVLEARWPKRRWSRKPAQASTVAGEIGALVKATLLDIDLSISVYLAAAEDARKRSEAEALLGERTRVVNTVGVAMAALSRGELTVQMSDDLPAEYNQLRTDFNATLAGLQATMVAVASASDSVRNGSQQIVGASDDLSRRTELQVTSLEETAAALDEITATVKRSAAGAIEVATAASDVKADAARSGEVMGQALAAMGEIEQSAGKVADIIVVIDEIAFQTNLLALNAGVEAARAGDTGRGFAVVAQEVRALAQRSAVAAKEIKQLIAASSEQVRRGVGLVNQSGSALEVIVAKMASIEPLILQMSQAAHEQAIGLSEVNVAVNQMDQVTQQNAAMVEEATAAATSLQSEAMQLSELIGQFQLEQINAPRSRSSLVPRSKNLTGSTRLAMAN